MNLAPAQLAEPLKRGLQSLSAQRTAARQQGCTERTERTERTVSGAHFGWSGALASGRQALRWRAPRVCEQCAARMRAPAAR